MVDPHDRAVQILTVYFRRLVEATGHSWTERNDRHMSELADCLIDAACEPDPQILAGFAAELDRPYTGTTIRQTRPLTPDDDPHYQAWLRQRNANGGQHGPG
jgi:hypothetical protein